MLSPMAMAGVISEHMLTSWSSFLVLKKNNKKTKRKNMIWVLIRSMHSLGILLGSRTGLIKYKDKEVGYVNVKIIGLDKSEY